MDQLNDWHEKNWKRMHEVFAPPHSEVALLACIGEEIGELCAAMLGVTGEKKRKAHLTADDVTDACADAATYLSLLLRTQGVEDLESFLDDATVLNVGGLEAVALVQEKIGAVVFSSRTRAGLKVHSREAWVLLKSVAMGAGCGNWHELLGDTFNMVSSRAGSLIKTTLGQP